ncbi:hypothetical protein [Aquimarina sp. AU474]|uniref:hypothetical protein n=1 Tax=Aquimarina sp. AU474 TaxID=2108529 RepID=UPI0013568BE0|nr:hypothetical protein [Aquimarina sp. AU474]
MTILSSKRYWITVLYIGLGFIVIFSVIEHFMQYSGIDIDTFVKERIENRQWMRYLLSRLAGGLLYGMIMGYYFELRKQKSNR